MTTCSNQARNDFMVYSIAHSFESKTFRTTRKRTTHVIFAHAITITMTYAICMTDNLSAVIRDFCGPSTISPMLWKV